MIQLVLLVLLASAGIVSGDHPSCFAGTADCDGLFGNGCEVNILTTVTSCGACSKTCVLPNAVPACIGGSCTINKCTGGYQDCDRVATNGCEQDVTTDVRNCGSCNSVCANLSHAKTICNAKTCLLGECDYPYADCNLNPSDGCEVNWLNGDRFHCGGCGRTCLMPYSVDSTCVNGHCVILECKAGYADCNLQPGDGCESFVADDDFNCGGCGNSCVDLPYATGTCEGSSCTITACMPGFADCNGDPSDGCEANLQESTTSCGTCGHVCPGSPAHSHCVDGSCVIGACDYPYGDCDHAVTNACETNLWTDKDHCGSCNLACQVPNGEGLCANASCLLSQCNPGWKNCNKAPFDGCETGILWDGRNCGDCGRSCLVVPNGTPSCLNGQCKVTSCIAGWGDCDGIVPNGCESQLGTDPKNCNTCGKKCTYANAVGNCINGACSLGACIPGWGNCDAISSNGCEDHISYDINNCGECGVKCSLPFATSQCFGGACIVKTCLTGYGDCDGVQSNGCEADLTSITNCGGCKNVCGSQNGLPSCGPDGKCGITCTVGWGNCDHDFSTGCETNIYTNKNHCGDCNKPCAGTCVAGKCVV